MKKLVLFVLIVAFVLFAYLRPLTLFFAARRVYVAAIGMKSNFVQVGTHRIHYWVAGEGSPLVLVHGVAMRAEDWAPLVRALAKRHRVYAPDLLGYGESDQPRDSDYSVAVQADVVRRFMDTMRLQKADVAGVSMGGWVALKVAAEHPERVQRLVLLSSAGLGFESQLTENTFSATTIDEQRRSFTLQSDLAPKLPDFILRDFIRHSKMKAWIVRASMRSMLTRGDLLMDRKLQRVRMPVLIVAGTNDRIVPFDVAVRLKKEMPHAQLFPLDGCGHLAAFECRSATLRAVLGFLGAAPHPALRATLSPQAGRGALDVSVP